MKNGSFHFLDKSFAEAFVES